MSSYVIIGYILVTVVLAAYIFRIIHRTRQIENALTVDLREQSPKR